MGLEQVPIIELLYVIFLIGCMALFVGFLVNYLVEDMAFGSFLNGFLLFVFFCTAAILYTELYQPIRATNPAMMLSVCIGGAFAMLVCTVGVRNVVERR